MNTDAKKVFERCAPEGHKLIEVFPYPDEDGRPVQFSARYEPVVPDGARKKTFRQFHAGANGEVIAMAMPGKMKPLYNLPELLANPNKLALVVEGEGKANRASERFLDLVVTTSIGGSNAVDGTDWSPLAGRTVVAWPDHDKAGDRYVAAVRRHVQLKVVKVPDTWPAKWDLGDNAPEGISDADLRQMIEEAVGLEEATAVEARPLPRVVGVSGNGKATSPNAARRKAEASAIADRYCDKAGNLVVTKGTSEEELREVVAGMDDVTFDRVRRDIAAAADVRAPTLDRIRADARTSGGAAGFPEWAMLPWPEAVDGDRLEPFLIRLRRIRPRRSSWRILVG